MLLQAGTQLLEDQQSEPDPPPASFSSDSWLPPMPADSFSGSLDCLLEGSLPMPTCVACEAPPACSSGLAQQPAGDQLDGEQAVTVAALDLGSLLGPMGDSWMGPLAISASAHAAPAAPTAGFTDGRRSEAVPYAFPHLKLRVNKYCEGTSLSVLIALSGFLLSIV